jgi:hypothetical protein
MTGMTTRVSSRPDLEAQWAIGLKAIAPRIARDPAIPAYRPNGWLTLGTRDEITDKTVIN